MRRTRRMWGPEWRAILLLLVGVGLATPTRHWAAIQKGIQGSHHDFSKASWNTSRGICSPCHQGRIGLDAQIQPIWGHAASTATFSLYDSPTFKAGRHPPQGASLACLSCHDGTVAINQLTSGLSGTEAVFINRASQIGPDLHTTHPISFTYDLSLAQAAGGLENPTAYRIGDAKVELTVWHAPVPSTWAGVNLLGQTVDDALLVDHKIECASCHDVHQEQGSAPVSPNLLRIDGSDIAGRGDLLCRTCHIK